MFGTHQVSGSAPGRSILALSVLALLALGCCLPVLAQAEDSSGIQYSDAPPTVTGKKAPSGQEPPASSSQANDGGSAQSGGGSPGSPGGGSSAGGSSSNSGDASGTAKGGDAAQQGSPGKGYDGAIGPGKAAEGGTTASSSHGDGGSSPLVPILIAIAALAAISLGAVMYRRHRGASSGSSVSPEAG
jgi:cobalamin biosynthesis Mg chelatase CobN